jgi:hypothetical protein
MAKPTYTNFITPVALAKFCWLDKPDAGFDGKSAPKFKIRGLLEDTPEIRSAIEAAMATGLAEAKRDAIKLKKIFKNPFTFPEDVDEDDFEIAEGATRAKFDEDHRGKIFFDAKTGFKPGLIDTALQDLPEDVKIMSGDMVKVKAEVMPYEGFGGGFTLRLKVVQLIEKNTTYSRGSTDTRGFGAVEGGYVSDRGPATDEDKGESKGEGF